MIALTLAEIASLADGDLRLHGGDTAETAVSGAVDTDSRAIAPGGVFVAKPGETTDGHLFIGAAVEKGAALALVERPVDEPVTQIVVEDVVEALARLAREVVARVRALGRLRVVGITGSNGKTTTKNMLAAVLGEVGETVAPVASFNNAVGAPLTMLRATESTEFLICELGADAPGQIARLAGLVTPDVGVVLMVGLSHAGGFGGIERTALAKRELVEAVRPGGVAVLNADDPRVSAMAPTAEARGVSVRWFGEGEGAQVRALDVAVTASGTDTVLEVDGERIDLHLQVLGAHHVKNAMAALTAAVALGVDPRRAAARLERVELAERWRMQVMGSDRVRIINDAYNASPDAMQAALRTLAQITGPGERMVAVLGAMNELGDQHVEEHQRIGLLAVRLRIPRIVVVGEEARALYLAAIAEGSWSGEAVFFATADEAYDYLADELRDGDRVLVKSSNAAGLRLLGDRLGEAFS
ncbi:UDP-N-acetylmuramoyl-tripeptide--D-alanyl-D-alanine ligase [Microbacterium sp. gxy059]|uniref:UDP-N-acetylmuramoyl-tripeptide--D-alanyl-D- alanine ligase n=1 Tax=Microbacterium sp. gxy059 TaxID=2957199 RepID=UPI003D97F0A0